MDFHYKDQIELCNSVDLLPDSGRKKLFLKTKSVVHTEKDSTFSINYLTVIC